MRVLLLLAVVLSQIGWASTACPATPSYSGTFGVIRSQTAATYDPNTNCQYLILAPTGSVYLLFTTLATESGYDHVRTYNGDSTAAPLIRDFTGGYPSATGPISSTQNMFLTLTSDSSNQQAGFVASYIVEGPGASCSPFNIITISAYTNYGTLYSNAPSTTYSPSTICQFLFYLGGYRVGLFFVYFQLEENHDYLTIYGGVDTTATVQATKTGNLTNVTPFYSTGGTNMLLQLTTDAATQYPGFMIYYGVESASASCRAYQFFSGVSGSIRSNNVGGVYTASTFCQFIIYLSGQRMAFFFSQFALESGYDTVRVYDGIDTSAPVLASETGSVTHYSPIYSTNGNALLVQFTTDASNNLAGFIAYYQAERLGVTCKAFATYTASYGNFSSNPTTDTYSDDVVCQFIVYLSGKRMGIFFSSFNLQANSDYVRIYDGIDTTAPLLATRTGSLPNSSPVYSSNGYALLVQFSTNTVSDPSTGFVAWYGVEAAGLSCPAYQFYNAPTGSFRSNNGGVYTPSTTCQFIIYTNGGTANLYFTSFATESGYDAVRVYDGVDTTAQLLGTWSGSQSAITVHGHNTFAMLVLFTSDGSNQNSGFALNYNISAGITQVIAAGAGLVGGFEPNGLPVSFQLLTYNSLGQLQDGGKFSISSNPSVSFSVVQVSVGDYTVTYTPLRGVPTMVISILEGTYVIAGNPFVVNFLITPPSAPPAVNVTPEYINDAYDFQVPVSWSTPLVDGGGDIVGYDVQVKPVGSNDWTTIYSGPSQNINAADLDQGVEYHLQVRGNNAVKNGNWTPSYPLVYPIGWPEPPDSLIVAYEVQAVNLQWNSASFQSDATLYYILQVLLEDDVVYVHNVTTTSFNQPNLLPYSNYTWAVAAVNIHGQSNFTNSTLQTGGGSLLLNVTSLYGNMEVLWVPTPLGGSALTVHNVDMTQDEEATYADDLHSINVTKTLGDDQKYFFKIDATSLSQPDFQRGYPGRISQPTYSVEVNTFIPELFLNSIKAHPLQ